jgi:hypothetical protein
MSGVKYLQLYMSMYGLIFLLCLDGNSIGQSQSNFPSYCQGMSLIMSVNGFFLFLTFTF